MIIVIDTNVFIGACMGLGASNAVIATGLQGHHTPCWTRRATLLLTEIVLKLQIRLEITHNPHRFR